MQLDCQSSRALYLALNKCLRNIPYCPLELRGDLGRIAFADAFVVGDHAQGQNGTPIRSHTDAAEYVSISSHAVP